MGYMGYSSPDFAGNLRNGRNLSLTLSLVGDMYKLC